MHMELLALESSCGSTKVMFLIQRKISFFVLHSDCGCALAIDGVLVGMAASINARNREESLGITGNL